MTDAGGIRVVFSADAFAQRAGGISRYVVRLHSELGSLGVPSSIIAPFHWNRHLSDLRGAGGARLPDWARRGPIPTAAWTVNGWATRAALVTRHLTTVFHPTYYTALPPPRGVPSILTVYDMIHELFGDMLPASERGIAEAKRRWCTDATRFVAISERTRADLLALYPVDPALVTVIHPGVDPRPATDHPRPWPRPYVLFVGNRGSYKNFGPFLEAYRETRAAAELDLVVFGGEELHEREKEAAWKAGVRLHRSVGSDEQLGAHYQHAHAFVCPSLYEGFGFPPLEAMTYACPVASSLGGALPEVLGEAAVLFDPTDRAAMAAAVDQVCFEDALRNQLVRRGLVQAAAYPWRATAHATLDVYERAVGSYER